MTPTRALFLASTLWATTASAVDITECGQLIRAGEVGELRRDLECDRALPPLLSGYGVILDHGGTVNLNGHTLRGSGDSVGAACFIQSETPNDAPCTVNGPGEITGFWAGMNGGGCTIVARDLVVRANQYGIVGPLVCAVHLTRVTLTDNVEDGVVAWDVVAEDVDASRNGERGLAAHRRLDAVNVRVIGNGDRGVMQSSSYRRNRARVLDSVVTGNQGDFDITWVGPLRLRGTRCGRAAKVRYRPIGDNPDETKEIVVRRVRCRGR